MVVYLCQQMVEKHGPLQVVIIIFANEHGIIPKVFVDPKNENSVYVLNVEFMHSRDGGKTFHAIPTPHSDHHDLWIDPDDGNRMIIGDDGGAQISFDAGSNWSTLMNQPTAQIYRVTTDNSFPYRILVHNRTIQRYELKAEPTELQLQKEIGILQQVLKVGMS